MNIVARDPDLNILTILVDHLTEFALTSEPLPDHGTITFLKNVVGGSALATDWTFDIQGGIQDIAHTGQVSLDNGSYIVTEEGPDGYALANAEGACSRNQQGQIALEVAGGDGTCTVTNEALATLTIIKEATPADGTDFAFTSTIPAGPALPTFSFMLGGGVNGGSGPEICNANPCFNGGTADTNGGEFFTPVGLAIDGSSNVFVADQNKNRIQKFDSNGTFLWMIGNGVNGGSGPEFCTSIPCGNGDTGTNGGEFFRPSGVTVDNNGNLYVADFNNHRIQKFTQASINAAFTLDDEPSQPADGVAQSITFSDLMAGDYSITELVPDGWQLNTAGCNGNDAGSLNSQSNTLSVTLDPGETVACTFENSLQQASLTVTKVVTNDNGGSLLISSFPLFVDGTLVNSGDTIPVSVGTHTFTETNQAGYVASYGGDCDANGNVTFAAGESKTCILFNDDIAPTLTLNKVVNPTDDEGEFTLHINDHPYATGGHSTTDAIELAVGDYTVSEIGANGTDLADYILTFSGDCDENGNISLSIGDDKQCTLTNTRLGSITLEKATQPVETITFGFDGDLFDQPIILAHGDTLTIDDLLPSTGYIVFEDRSTLPQDEDTLWALLWVECTDLDNPTANPFYPKVIPSEDAFTVDLPLEAGQNLHCRFHNECISYEESGNPDQHHLFLPLAAK